MLQVTPHLNGRLVCSKLSLQPLVFLPQILYSCQITSVVLRAHQQLLFPNWREWIQSSVQPQITQLVWKIIDHSEWCKPYLIQDSSSSRSLKNWCRRCDSFSLARRPAAMLLILTKRPLTASRLSLTWEVSKALLAIRLSAWPLRSFKRSYKNTKTSIDQDILDFGNALNEWSLISMSEELPHEQRCQPPKAGAS